MVCVLRGEMDPFVQNYARHCFRHHGIPPMGIHPQSEWPQHFDDSPAIDIHKWLNTSVGPRHPTEPTHHDTARTRHERAIAVKIDDDPRFYSQTWRHLV